MRHDPAGTAYRLEGEGRSGAPVVLVHGVGLDQGMWAAQRDALAPLGPLLSYDMLGHGRTPARPGDAGLADFRDQLAQLLSHLSVKRCRLVGFSMGSLVARAFATRWPERVARLALLNTLVYPEMSWAVVAFVLAARLPGLRSLLTSSWGLKKALQVGVVDGRRITAEVVQGVQEPFRDRDARRALAKAGCNVSPKGIRELAERLPEFGGPVRILYGERDRILPDVARTMARVKRDLPQAEVTSLADCGHFLQEERPEEIGQQLGAFFSGPSR